MNKYVLLLGTNATDAAANEHFDYCKNEQVPYIEIKKRSRSTIVHFDYISYDSEMDHFFIHEALSAIKNVCALLANKYSVQCYDAAGSVITFSGVDRNQAEHLAESLFDFLYAITPTIK